MYYFSCSAGEGRETTSRPHVSKVIDPTLASRPMPHQPSDALKKIVEVHSEHGVIGSDLSNSSPPPRDITPQEGGGAVGTD